MEIGRRLIIAVQTQFLRGQYFFFSTTAMAFLLVPPVSVRGMTCLDRGAFETDVNVPCLKLGDVTISKIMPILKKYLLKIPRFKPVQCTNEGTVVYMNPKIVKSFEDITETDRTLLSNQYKCFGKEQITLKYENWTCEEILRSILPEGIPVPTSFSQVGHIVHLNLRDVHLPYKNIIGQVFLDSIATARTVVNKVNTIDTTFRQFTMEILAGDKNTGSAVEFLDVFSNLFSKDEIKKVCLNPPLVHLYCFVKVAKGEDSCEFAKSLVGRKFGRILPADCLVNVHNVRDVSPNKEMIRVSFLLTESMLCCEEPAKKKAKTEHTDSFVNTVITENDGKEQGSEQDERCLQSGNSP